MVEKVIGMLCDTHSALRGSSRHYWHSEGQQSQHLDKHSQRLPCSSRTAKEILSEPNDSEPH